MKKLLLTFAIISVKLLNAQSPWEETNSPLSDRYDDVFFLNSDTGWAAGGSNGTIIHTIDGGANWTTQKTVPGGYFRSIEFADKDHGFAGGLEMSGQKVFYKTTDGGNTWTEISSVITGTVRGVCGICCVNTNVTYAVGAWAMPAFVMKTIDGGNSWSQINMAPYAKALIDVQFIDANNGYVTGQSNINSEGAVILKTSDGGVTWTKVFTSNIDGEYLWKIQNLDGIHWFASIEGVHSNVYNEVVGTNVFLKSNDGGNTWITKPIPSPYFIQGIGFISPLRGWIGNYDLYETNDGGDNWVEVVPYTSAQIMPQFDRFQKINDSVAYFSSNKINKLSKTLTTSIKSNQQVEKIKWLTVYPNPAKEHVSYQLNLPRKTMFVSRLFNESGDIISETVNQKDKGKYIFKIEKKLTPGVYYMYVMFNEGIECEKVIVE